MLTHDHQGCGASHGSATAIAAVADTAQSAKETTKEKADQTADSTKKKVGGTTDAAAQTIGAVLAVGALREAPANDIGSRSCLRQDEAIEIVYCFFLDGNLGLKLCFCIISTSVFESAGVSVLFRQDVRWHQSNC